MQTELAVLITLSIMCGLPTAYAAETSSGVDLIELPLPHQTTSKTIIDNSVSQPLSGKTESLQQRAAPDRDSKAPSAASVTALLNRFVRTFATAHGVQCPIPQIPATSPLEERHP